MNTPHPPQPTPQPSQPTPQPPQPSSPPPQSSFPPPQPSSPPPQSSFPPPQPSIRATCPNCGRFLGRIAGPAEFPPCHNCGWQTTMSPPVRR